MTKAEPKDSNELLEIWKTYNLMYFPSRTTKLRFCTLKQKIEGVIDFTYTLLQENIDMKQQIVDLTEELEEIESQDPFANYEPEHNEGYD